METQPASAQPAPADHFTNFAEISYDECEISEIPAKNPTPRLPTISGFPTEPK